MCKRILGPLLSTVIVFSMAATFAAGQSTPEPTVKVGDTAPDFTLTDQTGKQIKLSDFRGKKDVVLAFYVFAFTGG